MDALPANRSWQPRCSHGAYQHEAINITQSSAPDDVHMFARNMLSNY
jgi:hypothetical protein